MMNKLKIFGSFLSFFHVLPVLAILEPFNDSLDRGKLCQHLSHINFNMTAESIAPGGDREAIEIAIKVLDSVVNSQAFEEKLNSLTGTEEIWVDTKGTRLTKTLQLDPRDSLYAQRQQVKPSEVLDYLRQETVNLGNPFYVSFYRKWNPFSSEVAKTDGDTLKINKRHFSHSIVALVNTFFHESLHHVGFNHEFSSKNGKREKTAPYYFGDLVEFLISGLSAEKAEELFEIKIPLNFTWIR